MSSSSQTLTRATCAETTTTEGATAVKEYASLPTPVSVVEDNTLPLLVSRRGSKCSKSAAVVKDSNFRLNV